MALTTKQTILSLNLENVGPWGPMVRVQHTGNSSEVIGHWGPRYFVGGSSLSSTIYIKTAADTWSTGTVYIKTGASTWSEASDINFHDGTSWNT